MSFFCGILMASLITIIVGGITMIIFEGSKAELRMTMVVGVITFILTMILSMKSMLKSGNKDLEKINQLKKQRADIEERINKAKNIPDFNEYRKMRMRER